MNEDKNYPIVTESRPSTYPETHYESVDEEWPSTPLEEVIADLLDSLEVGSSVLISQVDHKPVYFRQRRMRRSEVAEILLEEAERWQEAGGSIHEFYEAVERLGLTGGTHED